MRVRNAKACVVGLQRFAKLPSGESLVVEIESVTLAPGEVQDVDDDFFASDGAQGLLADGTLVDVVAEAKEISARANQAADEAAAKAKELEDEAKAKAEADAKAADDAAKAAALEAEAKAKAEADARAAEEAASQSTQTEKSKAGKK